MLSGDVRCGAGDGTVPIYVGNNRKKDGDALDAEMCLALFTAPIEVELRQKMGEHKGTNVLVQMLHFTLNSVIIDEIELL